MQGASLPPEHIILDFRISAHGKIGYNGLTRIERPNFLREKEYPGEMRLYFGKMRLYFREMRLYFGKMHLYFGEMRLYFGEMRLYFGEMRLYIH